MTAHVTDVAIIGAGPVGLFAVFECGMLKMKCHVIDALETTGGQCAALYPEKPIYDIPGYPAIDAADLIQKLEQQAAPFEPVYHLGQQVDKLTQVGDRWHLETSTGTRIDAKAVIIAAGVGAFGPNRPPLERLAEFEGKSVFYLVKRKEDMRGKRVVIAGGGDSALDWTWPWPASPRRSSSSTAARSSAAHRNRSRAWRSWRSRARSSWSCPTSCIRWKARTASSAPSTSRPSTARSASWRRTCCCRSSASR